MLLMMSENIARNMQSSQGTINYFTQLHLVGHFVKIVLMHGSIWIHECLALQPISYVTDACSLSLTNLAQM